VLYLEIHSANLNIKGGQALEGKRFKKRMEGEDRYIGKQIGNYVITSSLNSGAFGHVYKGTHLYLSHRVVAIKILHLTHLASDEEREHFLQEAEFLELLKHPYILPIYDVGIDDDFPYLVAEFAPNGSLRDRIKQAQPRPLELDVVIQILSQVGQALQYVHQQNIVHRDLKPENILFNIKDEALIADFGIAVFLGSTRTQYADVIGSPLYMAPEQFDGLASRRSDQYSLACIAYELLTGRPPFMAQFPLAIGMKHQKEAPVPPSQLNPDIPEHIEHALLTALAKRREERFPDIDAFITALLTAPTGKLPKSNEQRLEEAYRLFNAERYQEALAAFNKIIQTDVMYADAYEGKGAALYSLGRLDEALRAYEQAIRLNPAYASAHNGKGNILYDLERYVEALRAYDLAVQYDATFVDAYVGKGSTLYYLTRYDEAMVSYDQALRLDPNHVAALDGKGWLLWHTACYQEALGIFERAISLDPTYVSSHTGKGKAFYNLGLYTEALHCYERAVKLAPESDRFQEYKADALYRLKHYEAALAAYEKSIALNPHVASSHEGRAWVLVSLKRYQEALAAFEDALQINPDAAVPYGGKGNALYSLGRLDEALAAFERALQINPHLASAYNGKGNVLADFKRYDEGLAAYEEAIRLQPKRGAFHNNKADILKLMGRLDEAQQEYALARQYGYSG